MEEERRVVIKLEELLRDASLFPYLALVAFEVGGLLRLCLLLLLLPLATLIRLLVSKSAGDKVLIFGAVAGASLKSLNSAATAALPKFFAAEVRLENWRLSHNCGRRRFVIAEMPRVMVETFLKDYLGVEEVVGAELGSFMGRATGLVLAPRALLDDEDDLSSIQGDFLDKEVAPESSPKLPKPVIFHDGRLAQKPTPLSALLLLLWFPIGFFLAIIRISAGSFLPISLLHYVFPLLGINTTIKGNPLPSNPQGGTLIVCNHRTLLDPIFLSLSLRRPITAVTFSISRLSELLSPIRTVRLTRNRDVDSSKIKKLLNEGDIVICPEGTTCREPFLLRFSSMFTELGGEIAPVAVNTRCGLFHGTTVRGFKGLDPFFFFMNPLPKYEIIFLGKVPREMRGSGHDLANYVQRAIADALSFECTTFTRRDKYRVLAGKDGGDEPKLKVL